MSIVVESLRERQEREMESTRKDEREGRRARVPTANSGPGLDFKLIFVSVGCKRLAQIES